MSPPEPGGDRGDSAGSLSAPRQGRGRVQLPWPGEPCRQPALRDQGPRRARRACEGMFLTRTVARMGPRRACCGLSCGFLRFKLRFNLGASPPPNAAAAGLNPGLSPGLSPGLNPGLNPGLSPGLNAGLNPGLSPGLNAGLNAGESWTESWTERWTESWTASWTECWTESWTESWTDWNPAAPSPRRCERGLRGLPPGAAAGRERSPAALGSGEPLSTACGQRPAGPQEGQEGPGRDVSDEKRSQDGPRALGGGF
jgi:hypothetical protein